MQFKYRTNSILHPLNVKDFILNYHTTSNFIEVGYSKYFIYQNQVDIFNIYNPSRQIILKDYSQRYGIISESHKFMANNVFC